MSSSQWRSVVAFLALGGLGIVITWALVWRLLPLSSLDRAFVGWVRSVVTQGRGVFMTTSPTTAPFSTLTSPSTLTPSPSQLPDLMTHPATFSAAVQEVHSPQMYRRPTATHSAVVARVIDGDTIELTNGQVVRYIGIDTPETKHPVKGVECFGPQASAYNQTLVMGKEVVLEPDVSQTDRYGRLLRFVWVDHHLVNWQLVAAGYAKSLAYPPDLSWQFELAQAQAAAKELQVGLWGACLE